MPFSFTSKKTGWKSCAMLPQLNKISSGLSQPKWLFSIVAVPPLFKKLQMGKMEQIDNWGFALIVRDWPI